jgi:hypothetical protein
LSWLIIFIDGDKINQLFELLKKVDEFLMKHQERRLQIVVEKALTDGCSFIFSTGCQNKNPADQSVLTGCNPGDYSSI